MTPTVLTPTAGAAAKTEAGAAAETTAAAAETKAGATETAGAAAETKAGTTETTGAAEQSVTRHPCHSFPYRTIKLLDTTDSGNVNKLDGSRVAAELGLRVAPAGRADSAATEAEQRIFARLAVEQQSQLSELLYAAGTP